MMKLFAAGILLVLVASGCVSRYPMGLTRAQWEALPPAQQAEYQARQYAIDEDRRKQAEAQRLERERIAAEQARAEQERLRQLYANARYGDIVRVNVQGGFIRFAGDRYPCEPVSFDIARGETKQVAIYGRGLQIFATSYSVRLTEDGNTITFDDSFGQRIVLVNRDWERGQFYRPSDGRNDRDADLAGMTFYAKYKELPGGPQRVIIERR